MNSQEVLFRDHSLRGSEGSPWVLCEAQCQGGQEPRPEDCSNDPPHPSPPGNVAAQGQSAKNGFLEGEESRHGAWQGFRWEGGPQGATGRCCRGPGRQHPN